jgi:LacI family transcriptional regulator
MKRRVTVKDIAKRVGCHHTTVSRALHNSPLIPEETRRKILRVAERMGYTPEPMLAMLASYRKRHAKTRYEATLAWLNNQDGPEASFNEPHRRRYLAGATERAARLGFRLEEFWLRSPGMSAARARQILRARGVQGLILPPQPKANATLDFDFSGFSAVSLGYTLVEPQLHIVSPDQFYSMLLLIRNLRRLGRKRIGLALPRMIDERVANHFIAPYLHQVGGVDGAGLLVPPLDDVQERTVAEWHARHRPDAIICQHYVMPEICERLGLRVGRDISIALTSVHDGGKYFSGIDERGEAVGHAAVDHLVTLMHHGHDGTPEVANRTLVSGKWVDGMTA